jgi:hypothetical protein
MIVFSELSLRRTLKLQFDYYQRSRTHLVLEKDAPEPRPVQLCELGAVVEIPQGGGSITLTSSEQLKAAFPSEDLESFSGAIEPSDWAIEILIP